MPEFRKDSGFASNEQLDTPGTAHIVIGLDRGGIRTVPTQLQPGQFRFKSIGRLGEGGFGYVDEVEITESRNRELPVGTRLARKVLNEKWAANPQAVQRFEREIRALRKMLHRNILPLKGENLSSGNVRFYLMPVYPETLRSWMHSNPGGLLWSNSARFCSSIAYALAHAHESGFIHRDVKPENVLIDAERQPIIADWGLGYFFHQASVVLTQLTRGGLGTPYYCSVEQWLTGKCGPAGDVYSLGMMMAELAAGKQIQISQIGQGISVDVIVATSRGALEFNRLVREMTAPQVGNRIQTMQIAASRLSFVASLE